MRSMNGFNRVAGKINTGSIVWGVAAQISGVEEQC